MGFTQSMLLNLRNKWNQSADSSKQWQSEFFTGRKRKKRSCPSKSSLQKSDGFHATFTKAIISLHFFDNSVHVQFIQKVTRHSFKVNHSIHNHFLFYNYTITIFMSTPADGKTISLPLLYYLPLSPVGPHSSLWAYFNKKCDAESLGHWVGL